jgi:hypothetical protein
MKLGRIALATAVAAGAALAGTATANAAGVEDLGPTPQICNVYAPTPNCFYAAVSGTDTFNLGGHLLFKGQEVSGTYRWEIGGQGGGENPSYGAVTVLAGGPGLKLVHCHGPRGASNSDAKWGTPHAFDITKGHTTCTWRAVSPTNTWVNGPGLAVLAGGQNYTAGDFYAVLSKGAAIDGHVTEQNVQKKIQDLTGIADATVRINGPRGYHSTARTSDTGYYHALVPRAGTYTVTPSVPNSYFKGTAVKRASEPKFRKVNVHEEDVSTADFTYKSSLKLTLKLDQTSVPADGMSFVNATVTATDGGAPVQNLTISLRPFGGGSALQSPFNLSVPATICSVSGASVGGRVWPDPNAKTPNTDSVDITTDSTGQASLRVYTGTVPGTFPLSVWAKNDDGKLIAQNASDVSDDADIKVTALTDGGDPPAALHNWLNLPNNATLAGSLPTDIGSLVGALGTAIHTANLRSAFVLTPVQTPKGFQGLLMSPEGSRVKFDPATGAIDASSTGFLLTPNELNGKNLYAGGFWGYIKTTATPAEFATLSQWLAGAAPGYSYPGNAGPITLLNASRLQYAGFGYGPACT